MMSRWKPKGVTHVSASTASAKATEYISNGLGAVTIPGD